MYLYVDNENVAFNPKVPIAFTPFGAFDEPSIWPWARTKSSNWSFGGAKTVPKRMEEGGHDQGQNQDGDDESQISGKGKVVLSMKNYFRKFLGFKIGDKEDVPYSMNINLVMCRSEIQNCDPENESHVIPIVVDPDTSNGRGSGG